MSSSFPLPLSENEEKEYVELMEAGDPNAKDVLIERNLRLVAHIGHFNGGLLRDGVPLLDDGDSGGGPPHNAEKAFRFPARSLDVPGGVLGIKEIGFARFIDDRVGLFLVGFDPCPETGKIGDKLVEFLFGKRRLIVQRFRRSGEYGQQKQQPGKAEAEKKSHVSRRLLKVWAASIVAPGQKDRAPVPRRIVY